MRLILLVALTVAWLFNCVTAAEPIASGLNHLAIYDPGTHERGIPAVILEEIGGQLAVDIPPMVHVHRYYYSGDKEIQGPIINGGPTIVVANHPRTGNRMYIDVVLPAGATKVAYNVHGITYVFDEQRVGIHF